MTCVQLLFNAVMAYHAVYLDDNATLQQEHAINYHSLQSDTAQKWSSSCPTIVCTCCGLLGSTRDRQSISGAPVCFYSLFPLVVSRFLSAKIRIDGFFFVARCFT